MTDAKKIDRAWKWFEGQDAERQEAVFREMFERLLTAEEVNIMSEAEVRDVAAEIGEDGAEYPDLNHLRAPYCRHSGDRLHEFV